MEAEAIINISILQTEKQTQRWWRHRPMSHGWQIAGLGLGSAVEGPQSLPLFTR